MRRALILSLAIAAMLATASPPSDARADAFGTIYWGNQTTGAIQTATPTGKNVQDIVTGLGVPGTPVLDLAAGKIYWADAGTGKIQRANLDGSVLEDLVTGLSSPTELVVDLAGGKMYWIGSGKIQRAGLSGAGLQDLVTGLVNPFVLRLDTANGKMYWTDTGAGTIRRANLDGSVVEILITSAECLSNPPFGCPSVIALDVVGQKLYWAEALGTLLRRSNLDGTAPETLGVFNGTIATSMVLDQSGATLYWAVAGLGSPTLNSILIYRAVLDGSAFELIFAIGLLGPNFSATLTLDEGNGKIYWAGAETRRANLDGSHMEVLITGIGNLTGVALNVDPPSVVDTDLDGCTDKQEAGLDPAFGGLRDATNFWDLFDPSLDGAVAFADFLLVLQHFNTNDNGGAATINRNTDPLSPAAETPAGVYSPRYDRGGQTGANGWNQAPANGSIAFADFLALLVQFGHTCA